MRNYWIKIGLGALGIFALGMIIVTVFRTARRAVATSESITIPLGVVDFPFRVDGEQLGTVERLTILHSAPGHVSGVDIAINLADTASLDRLNACVLSLHDLEHVDENTSFYCATPADTAGGRMTPFGTIRIEGRNRTFTFVLPPEAIREIHGPDAGERFGEIADSVTDSIDMVVEAQAESIAAHAESLAAVQESLAERNDSIVAAAEERADSIWRVQAELDSLRSE